MAKPIIDAEVGIDVVGGDLDKALAHIENRVKAITKLVAKAGVVAEASGTAVNKKFDHQMKAMQATLGQLRTVASYIDNVSKTSVNNAVADKAFAQKTLSASQYAKTLRNQQSLEDGLLARLNAREKLNARIGSQNSILSRKDIQETERRKRDIADLARLEAEYAQLNKRARRSGGDFSANQSEYQAARSRLAAAVSNPRRKNFEDEFSGLEAQLDRYAMRLKGVRAESLQNLQVQRTLAAAEVRGLNSTAQVEQERAAILRRRVVLEQTLRNGSEQEKTRALELLAIDKARTAALDKRAREVRIPPRPASEIRAEETVGQKATRILSVAEMRDLTSLAQIDQQRAAILQRRAALEQTLRTGTTQEKTKALELLAIDKARTAELDKRAKELAIPPRPAREIRADETAVKGAERILSVAEMRDLSTLAQVEQQRLAILQRRATLEQVLRTGTAQEKAKALELLAIDKARTAELDKRTKALTPKAAPAPEAPRLFGSGGATGVLARTAGYAAAGSAIYGAVSVIQQATTASIEFEEAIDKLGAISGSTEGQMVGLRDTILEVSRSSRFSAQELAEASTQLAQAGFSAGGVADSLKAASDLAIASGSSMAESVDIMTASMGAFQMQEQDAGLIANGLVAALNKSRLAMPQVALGIQYAGVTANEQNISFQELTASMAAMAQAGIRSGSTIGTGLRQFLTDLQAPTQKLSDQFRTLGLTTEDLDVSAIGLEQVLHNLRSAGFGASEAYSSMEKRGAAAYLAMSSQLDVMASVKVAMNDQTAAAEAAAKAGDNLASAWQRAKNKVFEDFDNSMQPLIWALTELIDLTDKYNVSLFSLGAAASNPALVGLPLLLDLLGIGGRDAAGGLRDAETAAAEANEAYTKSQSTLTAFETAMASVQTRSKMLKDGSTELSNETLALMGRFSTLAGKIDTTKNSYEGLIGAMREARGEMLLTLEAEARTAANAEKTKVFDTTGKRTDKIQEIKDHPGYKALPANERALFEKWIASGFGQGQSFGASSNILQPGRGTGPQAPWSVAQGPTGQVRSFGQSSQPGLLTPGSQPWWSGLTTQKPHPSPELFTAQVGDVGVPKAGEKGAIVEIRGLIASAISLQKQVQDSQKSVEKLTISAEAARALREPGLAALSSQVDQLSKPGVTEADKNALLKTIQKGYDAKVAAALGKTGSDRTKQQGYVEAYATLRNRVESSLGAAFQFKPPKEAASAGSSSAEPLPEITRKAIISAMHEVIPGLGTGNGARTMDEHKAIYRQIGKPAPEGSYHLEKNGIGQDFTLPKGAKLTKETLTMPDGTVYTRAQVMQALRNKGLEPDQLLFKHAGTGPHIDVGYRKGRRTTSAAAASAREARIDMSNEQYGFKNATRQLEADMGDLSKATSGDIFDAALETARGSMDLWEKSLREFTQSEMSAKGIVGNEAKDRVVEMEAQIRQKRDELSGKIADGVVKNVETIFKSINEALERSLAPGQARLAAAEGELAGLDRLGVSQGVPSYVRTLAERRVREAEEGVLQTTMIGTGNALVDSRTALADEQTKLDGFVASGEVGTQDYQNAQNRITSLTGEIDKLAASYAHMMAQAGAPGLVAADLTTNVRQAVQAWQILHESTRNYNQMISEEVGPAIDAMQSNFSTFFDEIFSGSNSVLGAFGNMAKGIIRYVQQIVAKLLASKLIDMLLGLAMSFGGGAAKSSSPSLGMGSLAQGWRGGGFTGSFHGGPVTGLLRGGQVTTGEVTRDSSLHNLAKGEYVVRSAAVRTVGAKFMDDLNQHGAKALAGTRQMPAMAAPSRQEMSVYLVAPEEKPSMGPNDVRMVIQQDLLKDGATKRIIKHIVQGG